MGRRRAARRLAAALGVACVLAAGAEPAAAHIVAGSRTLRGLVSEAAWVVRAEVVQVVRVGRRLASSARREAPAHGEHGASHPSSHAHPHGAPAPAGEGEGAAHAARPALEVRVLEVLKPPGSAGEDAGDVGEPAPGDALRVAQHGHGVAELAGGEEVVLFLRPLAAVPELRGLAEAPGAPRFVSVQSGDETFAAGEAAGAAGVRALRAVRAMVGALSEPDATRRRTALRQLTLELLAAPDLRLAAAALRDLSRSGDALFDRGDAPRLLALVEGEALAMPVRVGLLAELVRRGFAPDAPARWVALLERAAPDERAHVIRALGAHPSPPVTAALAGVLADPESGVLEAGAAAVALGAPGVDAAVPPLADALRHEAARVRMGAVRGLVAVGTPAAREALAEAAASHDDAATRRRARAALRRLAPAQDTSATAATPAP